jgi:stalled ribosome rescue protein Dom34
VTYYHAVVWVDHDQARVIHFSAEDAVESVVHPAERHRHLHHKRGSIGAGHRNEDQDFYHAIAQALRGATEILVTGPANAKGELLKHLETHDREIAACIIGAKSVDHPSDGQLLAYARDYFRANDRLLPQGGSGGKAAR